MVQTTAGLSRPKHLLASHQRPELLWRVWDKLPDADGKLTIVREWQFLSRFKGAAYARFLMLYPDADPLAVTVELYRRPLR